MSQAAGAAKSLQHPGPREKAADGLLPFFAAQRGLHAAAGFFLPKRHAMRPTSPPNRRTAAQDITWRRFGRTLAVKQTVVHRFAEPAVRRTLRAAHDAPTGAFSRECMSMAAGKDAHLHFTPQLL